MKTFTLPGTEIVVPNVVLGLMRIDGKTDDDVRELVRTARDAGIDFVDHADVYGDELHGCERRFADALQLTPSQRDEITLQTKAGIVTEGPYFDFSYEHLVESVDGSLAGAADGPHRHPAAAPPGRARRARRGGSRLRRARVLGQGARTSASRTRRPARSTCCASTSASRSSPTSFSCRSRTSRSSPKGVAANMLGEQQSVTLDGGGMLDYCRLNDITIQAWSPFQAGFFNGVFLGSPDYPELNAVIDRLAAQYDVPAIAIATAWITRHPAQMQVVLGTTTPERVAGAAQGSDLPLTRAEWYELFRAAGHRVP